MNTLFKSIFGQKKEEPAKEPGGQTGAFESDASESGASESGTKRGLEPDVIREQATAWINTIKEDAESSDKQREQEIFILGTIIPQLNSSELNTIEKQAITMAIIDKSYLSAHFYTAFFINVIDSYIESSTTASATDNKNLFQILESIIKTHDVQRFPCDQPSDDDEEEEEEEDEDEEEEEVAAVEAKEEVAKDKEPVNPGLLVSKLTALASGHGHDYGKQYIYRNIINRHSNIFGKEPTVGEENYDRKLQHWNQRKPLRNKLINFLEKRVSYTMAMPCGISSLMNAELTVGPYKGYTTPEIDVIIGTKIFQALDSAVDKIPIQIDDNILKIANLMYRHSLRSFFKYYWTRTQIYAKFENPDDYPEILPLDDDDQRFMNTVKNSNKLAWRVYKIIAIDKSDGRLATKDRKLTLVSKNKTEQKKYDKHNGFFGLYATNKLNGSMLGTEQTSLIKVVPGIQVNSNSQPNTLLNTMKLEDNNIVLIGASPTLSRGAKQNQSQNAGSRIRDEYMKKLEYLKSIGQINESDIRLRLNEFNKELARINEFKFENSKTKLSNILGLAFFLLYLDDDEPVDPNEIMFYLYDPTCRPSPTEVETYAEVPTQVFGSQSTGGKSKKTRRRSILKKRKRRSNRKNKTIANKTTKTKNNKKTKTIKSKKQTQ
jgi:hypothetical protein